MKKEYDPSVSKFPFDVPDDADVEELKGIIGKAGEDMVVLETILQRRKDDPRYNDYLRESLGRMLQIAIRAFDIDPSKDEWREELLEFRGRFLERLRLTKEVPCCIDAIRQLIKGRETLRGKLAKLLNSIRGKNGSRNTHRRSSTDG